MGLHDFTLILEFCLIPLGKSLIIEINS